MEVQDTLEARSLLRRIDVAVRQGCSEHALQRAPHLVLLDRRYYRNVLRPLLSQWLLLLLVQVGALVSHAVAPETGWHDSTQLTPLTWHGFAVREDVLHNANHSACHLMRAFAAPPYYL